MLQIKRQKGEPSRDFARRLAEAGDQCDLDNLRRHDFQIMCLIHNMEEDGLKSKLQKVRNPTWQGMLEKCEDHDRSRMTFDRTLNSYHEQSRQVTSAKGQTSGKKNKNKNKKGGQGEADAATQAANIAKLKGRCFTCAGEHQTKECSYPRTVQCNKCKKLGHLARCCIKSGPITLPERARQVQDDAQDDQQSRRDMTEAQANTITHWAATPEQSDWAAAAEQQDSETHYARRASNSPHVWI